MKNEEKRINHPSFGMLRFSRIHGQSGYLFGTEIQADNYIQLELSPGVLRRDLSNDWFSDTNETLFRVKMSPNQFSELITTLNIGSGVPVTIEKICDEKVEQCKDVESKKTYTHKQFKQRMANFMVEINNRWQAAEKIIDKKNLSKDDQKELKWFYERMNQELKSNIPFFAKCFQEVMDKIVVDAKAEIDSTLLHSVIEAGITALGMNFEKPKLIEDGSIDASKNIEEVR